MINADAIMAAAIGSLHQSNEGKTPREWAKYRKKGTTEMRSYVPGEDLTGKSVSPQDTPTEGDMIARNSDNPADQWLVARAYFEQNYEPAE